MTKLIILPVPSRKSGFTAFELLGLLVVFSFVIVATNHILTLINHTKETNQLADQAKQFNNYAIKYIRDNYRTLAQQTVAGNEVIISPAEIKDYAPSSIESNLNKLGQKPCVYVTRGNNDSIRGYLIFGNTAGSTNPGWLTISTIAQTISSNAGVLVNQNGSYVFTGGVESSLSISYATMSNMASVCRFSTPLAKNLLIVDISKNIALFSSIKGNIDQQSTSKDVDPSLKKLHLESMQTNIYLDNVYKESSSYTTPYCDASKLPVADANSMCQNYANTMGYVMYAGTAEWGSSILSGSQCLATAKAHFYKVSTSYSCDGVNMGDPNYYCPKTKGAETLVTGTAYWNPQPPQLSGNSCVSNVYAYYKTPGICDGNAWWVDHNNKYSRGDMDSPPNWQRAVTGGQTGVGFASYIYCAVNQPDNHDSMLHCPGTYNQTTGKCDIGLKCLSPLGCISTLVYTSFEPTGGGVQDSTPTDCGQNVVAATSSQSNVDLGFLDCGKKYYPPFSTTTGVPAQHVYRAIDYGPSSILRGQRIQIKTNAPAGATSESSVLRVSNAGLQAGLIGPLSHLVTAGSTCKPAELGKISQDMSSITINSQVQCTYNPTFCANPGYCFLPVKNTTFDYQFTIAQTSYACPVGTVIDSNQPSDSLDTSVTCPAIAGWNLTQSVHGEMTHCYVGVTSMTFCQGYQSVCTYAQGKQLVSALKKLRCSSSTNTYMVDNYIPQ